MEDNPPGERTGKRCVSYSHEDVNSIHVSNTNMRYVDDPIDTANRMVSQLDHY